eukprot:7795786-Karenia_brevis.AAC.1
MAHELHSERRDKAQLMYQSTMKNTTHVIPTETTPNPEFANGIAITGATGSATVFVHKDAKPDKLIMLP